MEQTVTYLLIIQKLLNLKQKILKIFATRLCLGNITKDFSENNPKKTG